MEYLNLKRSELEGELMQDASHQARSVWLALMSYCAGQENGGRIEGARLWSGRKWMKQAGLEAEDVQGASGLWVWEGEDLRVMFYPVEQEAVLRKKRRGGAIGGRKKAENRKAQLRGLPEGEALRLPEGVPEGEAEAVLLRKGKEGKEKEGNEREAHAPGDEYESSILIPTEVEVRAWAEGSAGVDPEFAAQKHAAASESHGWVKNGRLIDWRSRFKRYWEEDRVEWVRKNKKNAAVAGAVNGAVLPGDAGWWWTEGVEVVEKALTGALLGGDEERAGRLREILKCRAGEARRGI